MTRRPRPAAHPEVGRHLHEHIDVTRAELDAFLGEDDAVRLLVLAELRAQTADQETSIVLTLEAAGTAVVAIMLSRIPVAAGPAAAGPWWATDLTLAIACAILGLVAAAILIPSVRRAVKGNLDHQRAVVWLAAYKQAIVERRHSRSPRASWWKHRR